MTRFVVLAMFLGACGARSATDPSIGGMAPGGNQGSDSGPGVVPDQTTPRKDASPRPVDAAAPSCLPAPSSFIEASYTGEWKGTTECPPFLQGMAVFGLLELKLVSRSAESFEVVGVMSGNIGPVDFSTEIKGEMTCLDLKASMQRFQIGNGGFVVQLDGSMTGTYRMPGNFGGELTAKQSGGSGNCKIDGVWYANKNPE